MVGVTKVGEGAYKEGNVELSTKSNAEIGDDMMSSSLIRIISGSKVIEKEQNSAKTLSSICFDAGGEPRIITQMVHIGDCRLLCCQWILFATMF